ncbi:MAG: hypothetical protein GY765_23590, partial [bacterium]|nr:hypothetical protein [bacterium]
ALPFAIKMYESLLASMPGHAGLQLQTGSLYVMFANAFIQTPAEMLPEIRDEEKEFQLMRAKNLYLRGRDIMMNGLDKRYPGFLYRIKKKKYAEALGPLKKKEIDFLYWSAAGWLAAFALEPFDMKLGMTIPGATAMMEHVRKLDPEYGNGAIHDFYVLFYGAMPDHMGGDFAKARESYKKAVEASGGRNTSPHLSLATTVSVQKQNIAEFKELLNQVLAIDPDSDPDNRLVNTINQRKAQWLLDHIADYFLEADDDDDDDEEFPEETTAEKKNTGMAAENNADTAGDTIKKQKNEEDK